MTVTEFKQNTRSAGWKLVKLKEVLTKFCNGLSVKQSAELGGLPVTRIETISEGVIDPDRVGYAGLEEQDVEGRLLKEGDILFSHINSIPHLGKVAIYEGQPSTLVHGMNLLLLRPDTTKIYPRFLFYQLRTLQFRCQLVRVINPSVNQASVSITNLSTLLLVLPPLPIQRRIAAVLDKADALRRKRRHALDKLDDLLQAVFLDMFGDPVTNPKGWPVKKFGSVCSSQLGKMLSKKARQGNNPLPYLRNASVQWRYFELSDLPEMDFSEKELAKFDLQPGDVLVCEGGEVGRCAIWQNQLELCSFQKALHRVRPDPAIATSEYIQEYFFWMARRGGLDDATSQATIAHLTGVKLKQLPLPLPPLHLQQRFSGVYKKLSSNKKTIDSSINKCDDFFNALMQKAFNGELTFAEDAIEETVQQEGGVAREVGTQVSLFS